MNHVRTLAAVVLVGSAVLACVGGTGTTSENGPAEPPTSQGRIVVSPTLTVTATFVSATLGDDCGSAAPAESRFADCAPVDGGSCGGSFCQQSSMQIAFASSGGGSAQVEIASVSLRDASGGELATLTAREPRVWKDSAYVAWDQSIPGEAEVKASYDLSAPPWSTLDQAGTTKSYQDKFRLRVHIKVNGTSLTIESTDLTREPVVVT